MNFTAGVKRRETAADEISQGNLGGIARVSQNFEA
jgi:hypothetical protein